MTRWAYGLPRCPTTQPTFAIRAASLNSAVSRVVNSSAIRRLEGTPGRRTDPASWTPPKGKAHRESSRQRISARAGRREELEAEFHAALQALTRCRRFHHQKDTPELTVVKRRTTVDPRPDLRLIDGVEHYGR